MGAAAPPPGSLVILPEMFATGFSMNVEAIAEGPEGPTHRFLAQTARGLKAHVVAGVEVDSTCVELDTELAQVNHISVFMIGYGPDGGHNVHRVSDFQDGALVLRPLSGTPRMLMFHFSDQTF